MDSKALKKILLIEDDLMILESLKELLEDYGYFVETATNGKSALEILRSKNAPPNLILVDLTMPVMDGYRFRQAQIGDEVLAKIPTVMMSAGGNVEIKKDQIGADEYVKKPIEIGHFLSVIARHCEFPRNSL